MVICENCEQPFDPIASRWRCPHRGCGWKAHCCEGAPLPQRTEEHAQLGMMESL